MLRTLADLKAMSIGATDGEIGKVRDAFFDDHHWALRYLIADTGGWLTGRNVLISPLSIRDCDWDTRQVHVRLTREQVRTSPAIDTDKPVSRQHEAAYFDYYGYPYYWAGPFMWGAVAQPSIAAIQTPAGESKAHEEREKADPNLRSANEVAGYHIEAADGSIGHVEDFLFDDSDWSLRFIVVDTRNWLPGKHVLVSTDWVERVSWQDRKAHFSVTRDEVRASPEYKSGFTVTEADETRLHAHYGRTRREPATRIQIR